MIQLDFLSDPDEREENDGTSKVCSKCEQEKPLSDFYKNAHTHDGRRHLCKDCEGPDDANRRREYSLKHPLHQAVATANFRASSLNLEADLTERQLRYCLMYFNWTCPICGATDNLTVDHWIPLARGGASTATNVIVMCLTCNQQKHAYPPDYWLRQLAIQSKQKSMFERGAVFDAAAIQAKVETYFDTVRARQSGQ